MRHFTISPSRNPALRMHARILDTNPEPTTSVSGTRGNLKIVDLNKAASVSPAEQLADSSATSGVQHYAADWVSFVIDRRLCFFSRWDVHDLCLTSWLSDTIIQLSQHVFPQPCKLHSLSPSQCCCGWTQYELAPMGGQYWNSIGVFTCHSLFVCSLWTAPCPCVHNLNFKWVVMETIVMETIGSDSANVDSNNFNACSAEHSMLVQLPAHVVKQEEPEVLVGCLSWNPGCMFQEGLCQNLDSFWVGIWVTFREYRRHFR